MVTGLPVMGAMGPFVTEDPEIMMENIFGEIFLEGQQIDTTPLGGTKDGTDLEGAIAK